MVMMINKRNGSCSSMRSSAELATVVLALVLMASGGALADGGYGYGWIAGKKFTIDNITPFNGIPPCPSANPNTVAFYPGPYNGLVVNGTAVIVGEFDGAAIGVCSGAPYGVDPSVTITFEIWGDWVIFRVPDRVASASKVVPVQNGLAFINNGQNFPVSILTSAGDAN